MGITRRDLLKGAVIGTVALGCGGSADDPAAAPDAGPEPTPVEPPDDVLESARFPLGVSAGDLAPGGRAVVWTRYAGTAALSAYVWRLEGGEYVEQLGPFAAAPNDGGFVHVAIEGLRAGAEYRYTFFEGEREWRSAIGRFRAAIAEDAAEVVTFGAISCTEADNEDAAIERAAERGDLDAFLFLGDNAYCDGAETIDEYRAKYAAHFGKPAHARLRASTGMYITWDDHEVDNDWNPETKDAAQVAAAFAAFFDHAPYAIEVFVLDCRSERKPSTRSGPDAQYLSPEQIAWLEQGLLASPARFKLVMNSVPITNMPNVWDLYKVDRWEAYPAQRSRILQFIDDHQIPGVLWLAGDFHLAFISYVSSAGPGGTQREVLAGPGAQSPNALLPSLTGSQFTFTTGTNNYTTLRFDPATGEVRIGYVDGAGDEFHSTSFVI